MHREIFFLIFFSPNEQREGGGGCAARLFLFYFFPWSADHEPDWPRYQVVFFGLATNTLSVRNNIYCSSVLRLLSGEYCIGVPYFLDYVEDIYLVHEMVVLSSPFNPSPVYLPPPLAILYITLLILLS